MKIKKTAFMGLFLAIALILSYVETLIPLSLGIPGIKLGLANLAVVLALYEYGWTEALLLNMMRILLSGFLFGNPFTILYSMAGAAGSFLAMLLFKKVGWFSVTGVSMVGGICHNVSQLMVAFWVLETTGIFFYAPVLLAAGAVTGFFNGRLAAEVVKYWRKQTI